MFNKKCWFMLIIFSGIFLKKYFVNVGCASILDQSWIYSSFRLEYSFLQFADLTYHHIFQENIFDQCWIYWNGNVCIYSRIKIGNFAFLVCPNIVILDWQGKIQKRQVKTEDNKLKQNAEWAKYSLFFLKQIILDINDKIFVLAPINHTQKSYMHFWIESHHQSVKFKQKPRSRIFQLTVLAAKLIKYDKLHFLFFNKPDQKNQI